MKKTIKYISDYFFWPGMIRDIQNIIRQCNFCMRRKISSEKVQEKFIPREVGNPMEQIVMDIAFMDIGRSNKKYMIVIIDQFSKMISLTATNNQNEATVKNTLLNQWIYKFGKPQKIVTDRGKVFEGKLLQNLAHVLNISWIFTSPYDHKSNGLAERAIRTVRDMIVTSLKAGEEGKSWDELLPRIEFAFNCTVSKFTGFSPMEIIYRRKINIHTNKEHNFRDDEIMNKAHDNIKEASQTMMNQGKHRVCRNFEVGEEVLVRKDPQRRKKNDLLYEGLYKIAEFLTPHQVRLETPQGSKFRRIEWLKRCKF